MSNRNPRGDQGRPVERTRVTSKQPRTPDVAPLDERDEDGFVGPGDPVAHERDVDVAPVRDDRDVDVAPVRDERGEDLGPDDPIRFEEDTDAVPPRETESAVPAPTVAAGMFLPVIILSVVALILILWFLL